MNYYSLKYNISGNVGDNIQTLATEQHLPKVDGRVDRDQMNATPPDEKTTIVMNGFFFQSPDAKFPPHENYNPIFFGFHISPKTEHLILTEQGINYLKAHGPVGCRDTATMELLQSRGIEAYYSKCLTLTFPRRTAPPKQGKVFIVDATGVPVPPHIRRNARYISHLIPPEMPDEAKIHQAKAFLQTYRETASLIITTKIHCAMPCIAMGIPVIFFGNPDNGRLGILKDLGVKIHPYIEPHGGIKQKLYRLANRTFASHTTKDVDWNPSPLDIEPEKAKIIANIGKLIDHTT
ncbi:MAG: polysaccharide pyruvyl transferase family protein [Verrucomicrobiota bacterium JB025]|nr:polysaccharide pyruvyl transferase family protein [Verrucomicrobiota bacterium JB025]